MNPVVYDPVNHVLTGNENVSAKLHGVHGAIGNLVSAAHCHDFATDDGHDSDVNRVTVISGDGNSSLKTGSGKPDAGGHVPVHNRNTVTKTNM